MPSKADDRGFWIMTYSGRRLHLESPRPHEIYHKDIAIALSRIPRFAGHASINWTVGQHSIFVSDTLAIMGERVEVQLWGLLHDAAEAYIGDNTRPLKRIAPQLKEIEDRILITIAERYGLIWPIPAIVKEVDERVLATEVRAFFPDEDLSDHEWLVEDLEPLEIDFSEEDQTYVALRFRDKFCHLFYGDRDGSLEE